MNLPSWLTGMPAAVTVCDTSGIILFMNEQSGKVFAKYGGLDLIGKSLLDCHPEPARKKIMDMMEKRETNTYTIEKNGVKKLIWQAPWTDESGACGGLVEMSFEIPAEMPHHVRG
ncbi:MAG: PAS domain-containing protein [Candidatus Wallbacteria bacterium]|nr:PAS domain-containing protein [Candidatus Wallbacteria bacterium]